ncbi:MAG: hypothetical protein V3T19_05195 [Acidiferrobacterales bacterium]
MRLIWVILVGLVFLGIGCDTVSEQRPAKTQERGAVGESTEIAKVKVTQAGTIYLGGKFVTLGELKQELARLKQVNGTVWYYRDNPQGEPPPQAMAVIQAIVAAKIPVKMHEKDFD